LIPNSMNIHYENYLSAKLPKSFYLDNTPEVAQNLIGKVVVRVSNGELLSGIINETEAYLSDGDLASHSAVGKTKRNSAMFCEGSMLYVYKIYGIHHCINAVTEADGIGAAVLIRSIIPLEGISQMMINRKTESIRNLCNGPGKLTKALDININHNKLSLLSDEIFISDYNSIANPIIAVSKRIGITKSTELELRFKLDNPQNK
jgi:DNA-3-methyladenine glycosylase